MPHFIKSSDPGAPQLTGEVGSLVNLLDAVLVNGFTDGQVATDPLGWTKPHAGTYKAIYQGGAGSTGLLLRVDDSATLTAARDAVVYGVESANDVDDVSNEFPLSTQLAERIWRKSDSSNATVTPWFILGDEKRFYLGIDYRHKSPSTFDLWFFGDVIPFKAGDGYHCLISHREQDADIERGGVFSAEVFGPKIFGESDSPYLRFAREYTQLPPGPATAFFTPGLPEIGGNDTYISDVGFTYPAPIDNGLWFAEIYARAGSNGLRGRMPGIFNLLHSRPFSGVEFQELPDLPGFLGRTFVVVRTFRYRGSWTNTLFELTDDSWS